MDEALLLHQMRTDVAIGEERPGAVSVRARPLGMKTHWSDVNLRELAFKLFYVVVACYFNDRVCWTIKVVE